MKIYDALISSATLWQRFREMKIKEKEKREKLVRLLLELYKNQRSPRKHFPL